MNIDHFFTIGQQHQKQGTPCEDYAVSSQLQGVLAFGAVSDGCGGANANTDIGARTLAYAFMEGIRARAAQETTLEHAQPAQWFDTTFLSALKTAFLRNRFTDQREDYLATLVGLVSTSERAALYFFGDGAYIVKYRSGLHRVVWFEFADNAPYYLNYLLEQDQHAKWQAPSAFPCARTVTECWTVFQSRPDGQLEILEEASRALPLSAFESGYTLALEPKKEGIEALAVLTDGLTLFSDCEVEQVAQAFTAFKNHSGSFVKRRLLRALQSFAAKGQLPRDDVAMTCVYYGD